FMAYNMQGGYPYFSYTLNSLLFLFIVTVPILTMKSMAEERKAKTDQLYLTAPISVTKVVLGKYLAMLTVYGIPVLISCLCPLIIKANGTAHLGADYAAIFAFFLLGGVYIAVGMFISSLTESQIIACVSTFAVLLVMYLWGALTSFLPSWLTDNALVKLLPATSFTQVFQNFSHYYVFDVAGLLYYVSVAGLFVYFTVQSVQKRRWS
ncbi:MAG: ABC transporter permease, partial [Oscillospiraceae bacterium]|nr:ABC transporter permease [Oscillospiraceae bacterium]